ncbi:fibroblast growth factor receptor 3-like [Oscarella lobularis]|uniref:fibroblast growth factor receptor 3-like n=1 Tax=Oscarella lobularis TaxID=121494 RepID=UPI003313AC41
MECVECVGEKRSSHSLCRGNAEPLCRTRTGDISWMPVKRLFVVLFVVLSCQTATSEASITCENDVTVGTKQLTVYQEEGKGITFHPDPKVAHNALYWMYRENGSVIDRAVPGTFSPSEFSNLEGIGELNLILSAMNRTMDGSVINVVDENDKFAKFNVTLRLGHVPKIIMKEMTLDVGKTMTSFVLKIKANPPPPPSSSNENSFRVFRGNGTSGTLVNRAKFRFNETHLTVGGLSLSESGYYTLQVSNCFGNGSTSVRIRVKDPAVMIKPSKSIQFIQVKCEKSLVLSCSAKGYPKPEIQWSNTQLVPRVSQIEDDGLRITVQSNLTVIKIQRSGDLLNYTCGVGNKTSRSFLLNVTCSPDKCGLDIQSVSNNSIQAKILPPPIDGGSPISYYAVTIAMSNSNASTSTLQEYNRTNDDTAIVFKNLVAGTSYNLSCAAYNSLGRGPVNYTVIDTKDVPKQASIQTETTLLCSKKATLSYEVDETADRYEIAYGPSLEFSNSKVSMTTNVTITIDELEANTKYSWKVRAGNEYGWGEYSKNRTFTTHCSTLAPGPVGGSTNSADSQNVIIAVSVSSGVAVIGLVIVMITCFARRKRQAREMQISIRVKKRQVVANKWRREMVSQSGIGMNFVIDAKQIQLGQLIGEGAFGCVFEGTALGIRSQPVKVAIKAGRASSSEAENDLNDLLCECSLMKTFHHPNVLHLLGVCLNYDPENFGPLIVVPFMDHGDVKQYVTRRRLESGDYSDMKNTPVPEVLSLSFLLRVCLQIAAGMSYLTTKNVIHRDLAARNCMLNKKLVVKVADFGLSRSVNPSSYYRVKSSKKLPIKWLAPECLTDRKFTHQSDVWAFGITAWEVFTLGIDPYPGVQNHEVLGLVQRGLRLEKPKNAPDAIYEILKTCWNLDPHKRPKFDELYRRMEAVAAELIGYQEFENEDEKIAGDESPEEYFGSDDSMSGDDDVSSESKLEEVFSSFRSADSRYSKTPLALSESMV